MGLPWYIPPTRASCVADTNMLVSKMPHVRNANPKICVTSLLCVTLPALYPMRARMGMSILCCGLPFPRIGYALLPRGGYSTQSWVSTVKLMKKAVAVNLYKRSSQAYIEEVVTLP